MGFAVVRSKIRESIKSRRIIDGFGITEGRMGGTDGFIQRHTWSGMMTRLCRVVLIALGPGPLDSTSLVWKGGRVGLFRIPPNCQIDPIVGREVSSYV